MTCSHCGAKLRKFAEMRLTGRGSGERVICADTKACEERAKTVYKKTLIFRYPSPSKHAS